MNEGGFPILKGEDVAKMFPNLQAGDRLRMNFISGGESLEVGDFVRLSVNPRGEVNLLSDEDQASSGEVLGGLSVEIRGITERAISLEIIEKFAKGGS